MNARQTKNSAVIQPWQLSVLCSLRYLFFRIISVLHTGSTIDHRQLITA